jgi:hypothetical protein
MRCRYGDTNNQLFFFVQKIIVTKVVTLDLLKCQSLQRQITSITKIKIFDALRVTF